MSKETHNVLFAAFTAKKISEVAKDLDISKHMKIIGHMENATHEEYIAKRNKLDKKHPELSVGVLGFTIDENGEIGLAFSEAMDELMKGFIAFHLQDNDIKFSQPEVDKASKKMFGQVFGMAKTYVEEKV